MAKYETLPTVQVHADKAKLASLSSLPELVHLDDPALAVMVDFNIFPVGTIDLNESIDHALNKMKVDGVHLLLVSDSQDCIVGVVSTEDILGEKPITIIQNRRIERHQITVSMIMTPSSGLIAFEIDAIQAVKVGHIVNTLKSYQQHYALVIKTSTDSDNQIIRGLFNTSQISKQLHMDIASSSSTSSISDLKKHL